MTKYIKSLQKHIDFDYLHHVAISATKKKAAQALTASNPELLAAQRVYNQSTISKKPQMPKNHPYALMSQKAYKRGKDRQIQGYDIDEELSSDDRTVYKHQSSNSVVISYRGTDLTTNVERKPKKSIRDIWYSRGFRDVGADVSLATYNPEYNHRFYNAKKVAEKAIQKYGKENISLTGHSLGGSEAMYVSNQHHLPAVVHNPFIHPIDIALKTKFENVTIRHNMGDPVSVLSPWANAGRLEIAKGHHFEHGINNWVQKENYPTMAFRPPPPKTKPGEYAIQ